MKSFLIAATIALVGSSLIVDTASARSRRGAGMGGMAAMAPMLAGGMSMLGSGGFSGGPVATPYVGPIDATIAPVTVPDVYVPNYAPVQLPTGFGLPGISTQTQEIGG